MADHDVFQIQYLREMQESAEHRALLEERLDRIEGLLMKLLQTVTTKADAKTLAIKDVEIISDMII